MSNLRNKYSYLFLLLFLFLNWSCTQEVENDSEITNISLSVRKIFFRKKVNIRYAKHFTVTYYGNYKVVRTSATLR